MATHYGKQKNKSFARFQVSKDDAARISSAQFTIYDFIDHAFSFSPARKHLTIRVLEALKEKPHTFNELLAATQSTKSTLYLLLVALKNSGLIEGGEGKNSIFRLSPSFSGLLSSYAGWWADWVKN